MPKPTTNPEQTGSKPEVEQEVELSGTLFSVMTLAAIIIISWIGAFYLFLIRN